MPIYISRGRFTSAAVKGMPANARRGSMTISARIAVTAALFLAGTSFATAKIRGAAAANGNPLRPGINETTPRPTAAD